MGHLVYGAMLGASFAWLRERPRPSAYAIASTTSKTREGRMHAQRGLRVQPPQVARGQALTNYDIGTEALDRIQADLAYSSFKDGQHMDTVVGAVPTTHLVEKIEQHLG